jgi:hypothetical protein
MERNARVVDQKTDTEQKPEEVDPASRHREELRRSPVESGHFERIHAREMVVVESQEMFQSPTLSSETWPLLTSVVVTRLCL